MENYECHWRAYYERGPIRTKQFAPEAPEFGEMDVEQEILVTGIKVMDLLSPYAKCGKVGLFGGAGIGKIILIMELVSNITKAQYVYFVFASVGERTHEDNDLYHEMTDSDVINLKVASSKVALVYSQMNEPPGAPAVVLTGLTVSEYFRDMKVKMYCCLSITSSISPRLAQRCLLFGEVFLCCLLSANAGH